MVGAAMIGISWAVLIILLVVVDWQVTRRSAAARATAEKEADRRRDILAQMIRPRRVVASTDHWSTRRLGRDGVGRQIQIDTYDGTMADAIEGLLLDAGYPAAELSFPRRSTR